MWDRRGGSITRVAETLVISVSQPSEGSVWDGGLAGDHGETAECATRDHGSPSSAAGLCGISGDGLPPGTWIGRDSDTAEELGSQDPGGDGIQIICRFDSPPPRPSPPSSPPPYPPPPPPTESPPTLAALSRDVSEFSSIIEIDGDSFCIRSRLAGREEPPSPSKDPEHEDSNRAGGNDSDSDGGSDAEDELTALVEQCRRFYESRLLPRWVAPLPTRPEDVSVATRREEVSEGEEEERPTSVDSGRESGTDSRTADSEEGDGKQTEMLVQTQLQSQSQTQSPSQILTHTQTKAQIQSPLEAKMALQRTEMSLRQQDRHQSVVGFEEEEERPMRSQMQIQRPLEAKMALLCTEVNPSRQDRYLSEAGSEDEEQEPPRSSQTQIQSPLEAKMALLRTEVSSLMRQDSDLFRQLLCLHDSIEALKHGEGSLSAGSSLSSLADIEEEDTISTPSTDLDRQSHLSSETDNFSLVKGDSGSERSFFSEVLHVAGMTHWAKTRMMGPDGLTPEQVAPPSPRQAALPPQTPAAEKVAPLSRHRKQGSCDSGIVDQEIRGQA